jgi:drug/metabolite transporter (DMT)-like permease
VLGAIGLLLITGTSFRLPLKTIGRAIVIGLLLSIQSYCLYAAVARLPVALALLTFNLFPLLLAGIAWILGGQRPGRRTLIAMPVILVGLTLALNIAGIGADTPGAPGAPDVPSGPGASGAATAPATTVEGLATRWAAMSAGVAFAFAAATSFSLALYLTTRWLNSVDGRLRAVLTMATVGVVVLVAARPRTRWAWSPDPPGRRGAPFHCPMHPSAGSVWRCSACSTPLPSSRCSCCCPVWGPSTTPRS